MSVALSHDVHGPEAAPVLLLGSSLGTTRTLWDEQLPALAERFRVVRYDHRGHGDSPTPDGPYALTDLAGDVIALLDDLGVRRAHLAGVSLGGMVAMQIAGTAPERVGRLALVCTSSAMAPGVWRERAAAVRTGGMTAVADTVAGRWFTEPFATTERAEQLRGLLRSGSAEGYASCCEAIAGMELSAVLGSVTAPTLVVAGADDRATPAEHGAAIVEGILAGGGDARMVIAPRAAHLANVERPEVVTPLLLEHLTDPPGGDDGRR
ncbi:MAG: 3-oxoadipate enol-lactonase [Propionibacteriales bacterium]|nr:3-oxoadipate enol-lactonase [Propionibacteriales bacterium]